MSAPASPIVVSRFLASASLTPSPLSRFLSVSLSPPPPLLLARARALYLVYVQASASADGIATVFDMSNYRKGKPLDHHGAPVLRLVFSPHDSDVIATCTATIVSLWRYVCGVACPLCSAAAPWRGPLWMSLPSHHYLVNPFAKKTSLKMPTYS